MVRQAHHERRSEDFEKALVSSTCDLPIAGVLANMSLAARTARERAI